MDNLCEIGKIKPPIHPSQNAAVTCICGCAQAWQKTEGFYDPFQHEWQWLEDAIRHRRTVSFSALGSLMLVVSGVMRKKQDIAKSTCQIGGRLQSTTAVCHPERLHARNDGSMLMILFMAASLNVSPKRLFASRILLQSNTSLGSTQRWTLSIHFIADRCAVVASPALLCCCTVCLCIFCCKTSPTDTDVSLMCVLSPSQMCLIMDDKAVAGAGTSAIWGNYVVCSGSHPSPLFLHHRIISHLLSPDLSWRSLSFHLTVLQHLFSTSFSLLCSIFSLSPSFHLLSSVKWERNELSWGAEEMRQSGLSQENDPNRNAAHTHTRTYFYLSRDFHRHNTLPTPHQNPSIPTNSHLLT